MIDLHTHVLPGLDDGARSLDEALEVIRQMHAVGVTALAATPHVREDYPTTPEAMEAGVDSLRRALEEAGIPVAIATGAEVAIDVVDSLAAGQLERLSLGQSGRYVLLEFPYQGWPTSLEPLVHSLANRGITGVIAHPERNAEVVDDPARLRSLTAAGCLVQITASSVTGVFGRSVARASRRLLELGLVHVLATDLHGPGRRADALAEAVDVLDDPVLVEYLTRAAPAAVLRGESVAQPPARRRRARWLRPIVRR
jgi:protein-tyrosine phosphatase